jgi:hypothetical protein
MKNSEEAKAEMKAARKALDSLPKRTEEDQEYWDANSRVIAAEKNVSWWRR